MFNKFFPVCLISMIYLFQVIPAFAEDQGEEKAPAAVVHTLELAGVELKGEEIDYKVQRDGKHDISLRGQSELKIDEIVVTADSIHVTYSKIEEAVLDLKGHVTIFSKGDKLRANGVEAKFDFGAKSITLKGEENQDAQLIRYNGSKATQMEAAEIQIQFKDQNVVQIKSQGPATILERKTTKEDDFFGPSSSPQDEFGDPRSRPRYELNPFSRPDVFGTSKNS